jgi:hypothetical protein
MDSARTRTVERWSNPTMIQLRKSGSVSLYIEYYYAREKYGGPGMIDMNVDCSVRHCVCHDVGIRKRAERGYLRT